MPAALEEQQRHLALIAGVESQKQRAWSLAAVAQQWSSPSATEEQQRHLALFGGMQTQKQRTWSLAAMEQQ